MSIDGSQTLLAAFTANEASQPIQWHGGKGVFDIWGTWGSATAKLQYRPVPSANWSNMDKDTATDATFTADGGCVFTRGPCELRVIVSGGTAQSLNATVMKV